MKPTLRARKGDVVEIRIYGLRSSLASAAQLRSYFMASAKGPVAYLSWLQVLVGSTRHESVLV